MLRIRIRSYLYHFPGSGSYSNECTLRENLTTFACWLGPGGPTEKENHVSLVHYLFETIRIHICITNPDPDLNQSEKSDLDLYQSEKQVPDPFQNGLDPQHCFLTWK
jgi:hypothetical protein